MSAEGCHASYLPLEVRQVHIFNPLSPSLCFDMWIYLINECVNKVNVNVPLHIFILNLQICNIEHAGPLIF